MAFQLIYTSAPRLLQAGRSGFGTVAKHPAIREALQREIEKFSQFSRQEGMNPGRIVIQFRCLSIGGEDFYVLSRIKDAGADYTGRTNHIAHHVVFTASEAAVAKAAGLTPIDVIFHLNEKFLWKEYWNEYPLELGPTDEININTLYPVISLPAKYWQFVTEKFSSAAILAPGSVADSCWVVYSPDQSEYLLAMFGESLLLHENPWRITFANELQPTDRVEEIAWRGIPSDSPLNSVAAQSVRPTLDLTRPTVELPAPIREFTDRAIHGIAVPEFKPQQHTHLVEPKSPGISPGCSTHPASQTPPSAPRFFEDTPEKVPVILNRTKIGKNFKRGVQKRNNNVLADFLNTNWLSAIIILLALLAVAMLAFRYHQNRQDRENAIYHITTSYNRLYREIVQSEKDLPLNLDSVDTRTIKTTASIIENACSKYSKSKINSLSELNNGRPSDTKISQLLDEIALDVKTKALHDIEIECIADVASGEYIRLKKNLDELAKLDSETKQKLSRFATFSSYWNTGDYPALVAFVLDDKNGLSGGIDKLDRNVNEKVYSDDKMKKAVLEKIPADKLALFPHLEELSSQIKALQSEARPAQPLPHIAKAEISLLSAPKAAIIEQDIKINWQFCDTNDNYNEAVKKISEGRIYTPEKADGNHFELLMKGLKERHPNAPELNPNMTKKALESSFFLLCDDTGKPYSACVNLQRFQNQQIDRGLFDISNASITIKEPLLSLLEAGQRKLEVMNPKNTGVHFVYINPPDNTHKQISKVISLQLELKKEEANRDTIEADLNNLETAALSDADKRCIEEVERWLGPWGDAPPILQQPEQIEKKKGKGDAKNTQPVSGKAVSVSDLFPINQQVSLYVYLKKELKISALPSKFESFLGNPEAKKYILKYIVAAFTAFQKDKGSAFTSEGNGWSKTNSDAVDKICGNFRSPASFTEAWDATQSDLNNAPILVQSACNETAHQAAVSLDVMLTTYGVNKIKKLSELKQSSLKIEQYRNLDKSIRFLAIPNNGSRMEILSLSIAPSPDSLIP